jgi:hypothetical protein
MTTEVPALRVRRLSGDPAEYPSAGFFYIELHAAHLNPGRNISHACAFVVVQQENSNGSNELSSRGLDHLVILTDF